MLARTPLQHGRRGRAEAVEWVWGLGHEVKVEELDEFHFDFSACGAGFEEGGYCQEAVDGFEGAGVEGLFEEGGHEG